tara:strand:- start:68 stop:391 length:324 start_codon:yes stop_codon:yes gene_type:complete
MEGGFPVICVRCGKFYQPWSIFENCKACRGFYARIRAIHKYAEKRKQGYVPLSRERAGRKAFYTRMANMSFNEPARFKILFKKFKSRYPYRAGQITRRINQLEEAIT